MHVTDCWYCREISQSASNSLICINDLLYVYLSRELSREWAPKSGCCRDVGPEPSGHSRSILDHTMHIARKGDFASNVKETPFAREPDGGIRQHNTSGTRQTAKWWNCGRSSLPRSVNVISVLKAKD